MGAPQTPHDSKQEDQELRLEDATMFRTDAHCDEAVLQDGPLHSSRCAVDEDGRKVSFSLAALEWRVCASGTVSNRRCTRLSAQTGLRTHGRSNPSAV